MKKSELEDHLRDIGATKTGPMLCHDVGDGVSCDFVISRKQARSDSLFYHKERDSFEFKKHFPVSDDEHLNLVIDVTDIDKVCNGRIERYTAKRQHQGDELSGHVKCDDVPGYKSQEMLDAFEEGNELITS